MKKSLFILASVAAVLGLQSCSQDTDPRYQQPADGTFVLNTPALQNEFMQLTPEGTFELVCSQPDYGYSAVTTYSAECSLTEDFTDFRSLTPTGGTDYLCRTLYKQADLAVAVCEMLGYTKDNVVADEDIPMQKVYFRAVAQLANYPDSRVVSNVVSYNCVQSYFAVPVPGFIYLVGNPEGWAGPTESNAAHYEDWKLYEADDAIGSKIYQGVFDIPAAPVFRFYTALTGWDADSYGAAGGTDSDTPVEFPEAFAGDSEFQGGIAKTKDSFSFPGWTGGKMTIIVDMSSPDNMYVTMIPGEASVATPTYIYLVGQPSSWTGPEEDNADFYANWRLTCTTGNADIYKGTFEVAAGAAMFRFYTALSGWDGGDSWGSQEEDSPVDCVFSGSTYTGSIVNGKGSYNFPDWEGGKMAITVNMLDHTIQIDKVE